MRDGPSLEEFKAQLPLADIVGRWVKLVRRGREFIGLCPFHQEKSPSFNVVEDKGFYHCFGCGAHGNAIDFVMQVERLEFGEAIERVAELAGIPAPRRRGPEQPKVEPGLYEANAAAAVWFAARLQGESGGEARAYLERRGLDRDAIRAFRIGWAPADRRGLLASLTGQGFSEAMLIEAGLALASEHGGDTFARFRERVMFPIADVKERIVGFGGRALGDLKPKYLNTAETPLFSKGRLLYNLARARPLAQNQKLIVVAEGYMDVIALDRAGLPAVAPLGTAIGEEQLALLWRSVPAPVICLDGDAAGMRAAWRAAERAAPMLTADRTLRFAVLPQGEDPDSLSRAQGVDALRAVVQGAEPLARFLWKVLRGQRYTSLESPETRTSLRHAVREYLQLIADRDVRTSLGEEFDRLLADELAALGLQRGQRRPWNGPGSTRPRHHSGGMPGRGSGAYEGTPVGEKLSALRQRAIDRELRLLAPILREPAILEQVEEELGGLKLADPRLDSLRQKIIDLWTQFHDLDASTLGHHLTLHGFADIVGRLTPVADGLRGDGAPQAGMSALEEWRIMHASVARRSGHGDEARLLGTGSPEVRHSTVAMSILDRLINLREEAGNDPERLPGD